MTAKTFGGRTGGRASLLSELHVHCLQGPSYDHKKKRHDANNEGRTTKLLITREAKVASKRKEGVARLEGKDCNEGKRAEHCMRYHNQYGGNLELLARVCFGRSGRTQTGIGASG